MTAAASTPSGGGAWSPFRHRVFAVMWTAVLIGNIGTWMRDVGAGWLMTTLSPSATLVALVQAAGTLPIFLLALPAGALADLVNRRRLLIAVNLGLLVVAVLLGVLSQTGTMTPLQLLVLLLAGGIGTALVSPVLQSLTPLQVPRSELRAGIALNSMGINVARAVGPALGGAVIAGLSLPLVFYIDAATYVVVIGALLWWKGAAKPAFSGTPESLLPAVRSGVRFALHAPGLQRVLIRAGSFFVFASSYWALLPLIARQQLQGDASYYGLLLACIGAGAVTGALLLPTLRRRLDAEATMRLGTGLTIAVLLILALLPNRWLALMAAALAGAAWILVLTTANTAAQTLLPNWVRGRGLAIYLTVFYGAMTAGSLVWGRVADWMSIPTSLLSAAALGALVFFIGLRRPLSDAEPDLTPSHHWPEPVAPSGADLSDRPVMVTVDYIVDATDRQQATVALVALAAERQRNGAVSWQLFEDSADPTLLREVFVEPSWSDHMRHHERITRDDADIQASVLRWHRGERPPEVRHFLAIRPDR
jgi:MFS family permease